MAEIGTDPAFRRADGDGFRSTGNTRGPWGGASRHAGPRAARS